GNLTDTYDGTEYMDELLERSPEGGFADEGVTIHVSETADKHEYLRFDCFDAEPHYHYIHKTPPGAEPVNNVIDFDVHAHGDMLPWAIRCLRERLPAMLTEAGKEPIFRHLDDPDMKWQKVRRQRNADGTEGTVIEKWFAFSPDPQYLSLYAIYSPGMIVRRRGHFCPHVVYIMEGGAWFGDRWCPVGTHIELPFGAAFGPIKAGDEGCTMFEVMLGDPRSWGEQPE